MDPLMVNNRAEGREMGADGVIGRDVGRQGCPFHKKTKESCRAFKGNLWSTREMKQWCREPRFMLFVAEKRQLNYRLPSAMWMG